MQGHVLLASGLQFDLLNLDSPSNPKIQETDIIIPLMSRFRWGCTYPVGYPPAQVSIVTHSVAVAYLVFRECIHSRCPFSEARNIILAALLHDVQEALLSDIPATVMPLVKIEQAGQLVPWPIFEASVRERIVRDVWEVEKLPFNHPFVRCADQDVRPHEIKYLCGNDREAHGAALGWLSVVPACPDDVSLTSIWQSSVSGCAAVFARLARTLQDKTADYENLRFYCV